MPEDAQQRLQANLQSRLRKLICKGLGYLDLSDVGTASQLEPALSCMKLLIERFKVRGQLEEACAAKQWLRLQSLFTAESTTEQPQQQHHHQHLQQQRQQQQQQAEAGSKSESSLIEQTFMTGGDKGSSKGGVYSPNVKFRSNPLVRNTGQDVILTCNTCGIGLRSSWVFEYLGKVSTLVPTNGHPTCGGKYVQTDATITLRLDITSNLDICPHGSVTNQCVKCGGSRICAHKRRISSCPPCLAERRKAKSDTKGK
ncbi:unnamed protein product, partial [Polarella glacialis]